MKFGYVWKLIINDGKDKLTMWNAYLKKDMLLLMPVGGAAALIMLLNQRFI